jgi:SET domain-containing protein
MSYFKLFIIFIVILVSYVLFRYIFKSLFLNIDYVVPQVEIKKSEKIGSRGVFATKDYKKNDVIEICPTITEETSKFQGILKDYIFKYDDKNSLLAFGFCSMYNHSDNYNALWTILSKEQMKFYATKDIKKGEEILISYGDGYWKTRNDLKK